MQSDTVQKERKRETKLNTKKNNWGDERKRALTATED
jgi:hypothetical protein